MTRLVFIHGFDDPSVWDLVIAQPSLQKYECVPIELPCIDNDNWREMTIEDATECAIRQADCAAPVVLVGHSLGGVVATLAAEAAPTKFAGIVNIEGNVTSMGSVFSKRAALADDYEDWFLAFRSHCSPRWGKALDRWNPHALRHFATEVLRVSLDDEIGSRYKHLHIPRLYVTGTQSTTPTTRAFLQGENHIALHGHHWLPEEQPIALAAHLAVWAQHAVETS